MIGSHQQLRGERGHGTRKYFVFLCVYLHFLLRSFISLGIYRIFPLWINGYGYQSLSLSPPCLPFFLSCLSVWSLWYQTLFSSFLSFWSLDLDLDLDLMRLFCLGRIRWYWYWYWYWCFGWCLVTVIPGFFSEVLKNIGRSGLGCWWWWWWWCLVLISPKYIHTCLLV